MPNFYELISSVGLYIAPFFPLVLGARRSEKMVMEKTTESMNMKNVASMTVISSLVLLGLYVIIKFISADYLQYLLTCYFMFIGSVGVSELFQFIFQKYASPEKFGITIPIINYKFETSKSEILGMAVGFVFSLLWAVTKHWTFNNFLAFCLTIVAIGEITTPSFKIASIMLIALFVYDIFWVFGSEVMLTVATNVDGPIKFIFPKDGHFIFTDKVSLLGLGDVAIPGLYIALMKRIDTAFNNGSKYFHVSILSYYIGLLTTFVVMHVFKHGQPALLYLVPALLIGTTIYTLIRGEMAKVFEYHDPVDEEEESSSEEENENNEEGEEQEEKEKQKED
ncbi:minor histocompatibility antigen H13, putative [Entamoeba invadens IP1]|uniref:Minor histocompatibility antigen H13, putative n=2 Tax=Entamoeba invadens TaxID=33085 RepID=L7FLR8_ENTIV|nr:minor histocompatibility antigen H13, putative [Entamoeba invadens IP1]ELP84813.1 minor histocompatibility antigen H13, putative [Entamoeba invadens IP1]BAN41384.1 minor histocompatibility antigen H13, putative [Entamoeba invadens]BAN41446.1 minor histocompatibility antigen H13, putative [Entamoeba invadens]|eukprot:XP_004184159.1 minor histocompatibility antigen H13, putative [Entamoeba invadens IP1]